MSTKPLLDRVHPAVLIVGAALLAAIGAFTAGQLLRPAATPLTAAKLYPQPRPISDFVLSDGDGRRFDQSRWSGHWNLVFFGFTHCPDVCPGTLNDLKAITTALRTRGSQQPQVTFISVDPERDTPEVLKRYVEYFNPEFLAATADHDQLQALTRELGVLYQIAAHEPGAGAYSVDHSASLLLIGPEVRLRGVFPAPQQVDQVVSDLTALIAGDGS